jgi:hypothetical protein
LKQKPAEISGAIAAYQTRIGRLGTVLRNWSLFTAWPIKRASKGSYPSSIKKAS